MLALFQLDIFMLHNFNKKVLKITLKSLFTMEALCVHARQHLHFQAKELQCLVIYISFFKELIRKVTKDANFTHCSGSSSSPFSVENWILVGFHS